MRWLAICALIVGCNFEKSLAIDAALAGDAAPIDAAIDASDAQDIDARVFSKQCPNDPSLLACLRFDDNPPGATAANEGSVPFDASLTNVMTTPGLEGQAALLDTTSVILVPPTAAITAVRSMEIWANLANQPTTGGRMGLIDDTLGMALFYYNANEPPGSVTGPAKQYIRCSQVGTIYGDVTLPMSWTAIACVCNDDGSLVLYRDGALLASAPTGCAPSNLATQGITVGQDNQSGTVGDPWVGAIDGVRLWSRALTAQEISAPVWQ